MLDKLVVLAFLIKLLIIRDINLIQLLMAIITLDIIDLIQDTQQVTGQDMVQSMEVIIID